MKNRLTVILFILCLAFSLMACSAGGSSESSQTQEPSSAESSETPQESGSESEEESSTSEETKDTPTEESGSEEEPAEETVPENVLKSYGLSAEEFTALKTSIQEHIDSEWDAEEAYLSYDNNSSYDLTGACTYIKEDVSADFMTDEIIESYIDGESMDSGSPLWKERAIVLAHAVNDWAAQQNVGYDTYVHIWESLSSAFAGMNMIADDTYLVPLFDLDGE